MKLITECIVTVFYIGRLPIAPGTWASMAATICWFSFFHNLDISILAILISIIFFIGLFFTHRLLKTIESHDPSFIVIDEWVGQWVALSLLPVNVTNAIIGFVLFRFFDITKLGPVKYFEKMPGAWGVMIDDLVAGFISLAIILIFHSFIL
ncbi:MAG: phosphatidylglycerophosphatase A [Candidatus Marinimicrobia bacterium]|nr:phosphatidylglycerophosphatase A [Candidatus Neomarinimicrobiota bacterium]